MSSDNAEGNVKNLEKKVEGLAQELDKINKRIEPLDDFPDLMKKIDSLTKEVESIKEKVEDDKKLEALAKAVDEKDFDSLSSKLDELTSKVEKVTDDIAEVQSSKEMDVLYKKIDDLLLSVTEIGSKVDDSNQSENIGSLDERIQTFSTSLSEIATNIVQLRDSDSTEVLGKKIDDLQQYVAGLSALEEKVDVMSSAFSETKEIVGIIVRQLDDIERKYNKAIEDISEAMEVVKSLSNGGYIEIASPKSDREKPKKGEKRDEPDEELTIKADASTIDNLMNSLLAKVKPQTEAKDMAKALEEVRDKLTLLIKGHTPVLFQFGTRARELKAYPPTATLNENDIARLNKEIRDWTSKLKKITTET
ncbi:MAG: hypothetical protein ACFFED_01405 [Candidatus Thorarchaeota archaeon]